MQYRSKKSTEGFTLIELSLVLVIIGLLVGGVLAGQSLIRAAELRAVNSESQRFSTAVNTFRDKYFDIPGDLSNASSFWAGVGNGSGDGMIQNTAAAGTNEIVLFWEHLSKAGLVEGSYTEAAGTTLTAGTNNPRSRLSQGAWNVMGLGAVSAGASSVTGNTVAIPTSQYYDGNFGTAFVFGSGTNALTPAGIIKAEEAWNIDTKMDDGIPSTGATTTLKSQEGAAGSHCSITGGATYDLTNTSASACTLVVKSGF